MTDDKFKIFCGTANPELAKSICKYVGVPLGEAEHGQFSDGETRYQISGKCARRGRVRGAAVLHAGEFQSDAVAADD